MFGINKKGSRLLLKVFVLGSLRSCSPPFELIGGLPPSKWDFSLFSYFHFLLQESPYHLSGRISPSHCISDLINKNAILL